MRLLLKTLLQLRVVFYTGYATRVFVFSYVYFIFLLLHRYYYFIQVTILTKFPIRVCLLCKAHEKKKTISVIGNCNSGYTNCITS